MRSRFPQHPASEDSRFSLPTDLLDSMMTDAFQARPSAMPSPTHTISAWEYSLPVSRSVRARKSYFSREIAEVLRLTVKPRILILGAGRLREADDALHSPNLNHVDFVVLRPPQEPVGNLPAAYRRQIRLEEGGWDDLSRLAPKLGSFDLIYSPSWMDACGDVDAARWLGAGTEILRPGGRLLAANFTPGSRDAGWIEACWNWHPNYRSEENLAQLVMDLKQPGIRGHAVFRDESGASAYLEIHAL